MAELTRPATDFADLPDPPPEIGTPPRLEMSMPRTLADRTLWTAVGVSLLWWAWQLVGWSAAAWSVPLLVIGNIWGLATVIAAWLPDTRWTTNGHLSNWVAWGTALLTVGIFVAWSLLSLIGVAHYGTDALGFDQYAAQLAQHGVNPYTNSMAHAYSEFHIPVSVWTYSFSGSSVTKLSYPSLSFLIYVPFLALGWVHNLAPIVNVMAWALTILLMFAILPRRVRPAALLLGGYGLFASFALGGVTDALFMPLLVLAAYRWDRFGETRMSYLGPVMFGLAMGFKQTPWPALPFILIALASDEHARSGMRQGLIRAGRYFGVAMAAFLIPNLPWIIASPAAWIKGTLTPIFASIIPTGQGLISLSMYLHLGGGSITAFTLATACAFLLMLVAFAGTYPVLRAGLFVLPGLAFAFGARSDVNYFISLIPAGLVAAVSLRRPPIEVARGPRLPTLRTGVARTDLATAGKAWNFLISWVNRRFRTRGWTIACVACVLLFLGSTAYALMRRPPIKVVITGIATNGLAGHVEEVSLKVTNNFAYPVHPRFDILQSGFNSTFWIIKQGPKSLKPHQTKRYLIWGPNPAAEPSIYRGFNVVGYLDKPKAFSVSATYQSTMLSISFNPAQINRLVPVGQPVPVQVQVYSSHGEPLHRAGIPIKVSELIWTSQGLKGGTAIINSRVPGGAAIAYTNNQGIASFTIVGTPTRHLNAPSNQYPITFSCELMESPQHGGVRAGTQPLNIRFTDVPTNAT